MSFSKNKHSWLQPVCLAVLETTKEKKVSFSTDQNKDEMYNRSGNNFLISKNLPWKEVKGISSLIQLA